jgi:uncharacterized protein with GYD domain
MTNTSCLQIGRLDAAKKALKDMSGEFKSFYLTMGDYDIVAIYEAPDDAVVSRFNLQLGILGNVRTRTLKAFPEAAYREIINSLGLSAALSRCKAWRVADAIYRWV